MISFPLLKWCYLGIQRSGLQSTAYTKKYYERQNTLLLTICPTDLGIQLVHDSVSYFLPYSAWHVPATVKHDAESEIARTAGELYVSPLVLKNSVPETAAESTPATPASFPAPG
jgi:hypothetical protein